MAKLDDVTIDPATTHVILEAKGGTGKLAGIWRKNAAGQPEFCQQMSREWVEHTIARMKRSDDIMHRAMAEELEVALKNGQVQGLVVSTPILGTEITTTTIKIV